MRIDIGRLMSVSANMIDYPERIYVQGHVTSLNSGKEMTIFRKRCKIVATEDYWEIVRAYRMAAI